nr:PREDICTED: ubiquinone biosynthesis monooxygenase COQ6, mitochondrial isoform X1 [Bemisia tabaci]
MMLRKLRYSTSSAKHYDVIITGGGLIGSSMACAISKNPVLSSCSILLLENNPKKKWSLPPNFSNRTISINKRTQSFLNSIGAWDTIENSRQKNVKGMKVWSDSPDIAVSFRAEENSSNVISHIVENDLVINTVTELIEKEPNITIVDSAKVKEYSLPKGEEPVSVFLENGTEYKCNLLIGADGANSQVRKTIGCQYLSWSYDQMAIVGTVEIEDSVGTNDYAWQRFIPTGPVALLPLSDNLSSLVWSTTIEKAKSLLKLPEDSFVDALNTAFTEKFKGSSPIDYSSDLMKKALDFLQFTPSGDSIVSPPFVKNVLQGSRAAFPLSFGHSENYVGNQTALVGDSAHKVHPLAGQGVNLGFGDIICLISKLEEALSRGEKLGCKNALLAYETERQRANVPIMLGIDLVYRIYGSQNPALQVLTNLSWQVANNVSPIKKFLMQQAS